MLFNTFLNYKLLKIDQKMRVFKNLEEIWKTWRKIGKKRVATLYELN